MERYNNLNCDHSGIVVGDERTFQRAMEVVHDDDEDDSFAIEPVDQAKD
jgi:hypothetical protein